MVSHSQSVTASSSEEAIHPKVRRDLSTKILVGVGTNDTFLPALDLLERLRLPQPDITLLHAADTTYPVANGDANVEVEYAKVMQNLGARLLALAKKEAEMRELKVKTEIVFGRAADCLIAKADQEKSDIIALCAVRHGAWSTGYMGSATCALALSATQSLLVAKTPLHHEDPLRAVLAIDHSAKTNALVQRFLDLAPQGIKEVMVLSAYEIDDETARAAHKNLPMLGADIDRALREEFQEKNQKLAELLNASGYRASIKVLSAAPTDALREEMKAFRGDLLIVGATGDASPASAKVGSVALHQILSEPYSVLMLRG